MTAKVAKIKSSKPKYQRAPAPDQMRMRIRHLAKWLLIALAVAAITPMVLSLALANAVARPVSECRSLIAGWHPDVPAHIRVKCRGRA